MRKTRLREWSVLPKNTTQWTLWRLKPRPCTLITRPLCLHKVYHSVCKMKLGLTRNYWRNLLGSACMPGNVLVQHLMPPSAKQKTSSKKITVYLKLTTLIPNRAMSKDQFEKAKILKNKWKNKVGLVASAKGSYYQKWSNNYSNFKLHEAIAIRSSGEKNRLGVKRRHRFCKKLGTCPWYNSNVDSSDESDADVLSSSLTYSYPATLFSVSYLFAQLL